MCDVMKARLVQNQLADHYSIVSRTLAIGLILNKTIQHFLGDDHNPIN